MMHVLSVKKRVPGGMKDALPENQYKNYVRENIIKALSKELMKSFNFEIEAEQEGEEITPDSIVEYSLSLYAVTELEFDTRLNTVKNNLRAKLENGSKANHEYASGIQDTLKILGLE